MTGERMTRTQFLRRAIAAFCGVVCVAGAAVALTSVESRSALLLGAAGMSALAGLALTGLAFARRTVWGRAATIARRVLARPDAEFESRRIGTALIALGLLAFVTQIVVLFPRNDRFAGEDEEAYLITAREIAESGGTVSFLRSLFSGEFAEANRHPLYLWLLSGTPEFGTGKFVSALLGLWTMGMVIGLCLQRQVGWLRTGLLCVMLGLNSAWGRFSVTVGCEVLLVGLVACVWFQFYGRPFRRPDAGAASDLGGRRRVDLSIVWVGVLLSLVWLTKGTGLLLTVGFVLWLALRMRLRDATSLALRAASPQGGEATGGRAKTLLAELLLFGAVWVTVASPLLVRNVVRYGSPFHNVNSWLLFVDEYSDPVDLSESSSTGEAARAYLAAHSVGDILQREVSGLFWETFILVRSLGPPPFDNARVLPGGVIALLAILGWIVSRDEAKWLLLIWLAICVPMFAWYVPVAAGERFVLPLLVPILCYTAEGAVHLAGKIAERRA